MNAEQLKRLKLGGRETIACPRMPTLNALYPGQLRAGTPRDITLLVVDRQQLNDGTWLALVSCADPMDPPTFLKARPSKAGTTRGDYTTMESQALEDEPEPIPVQLQARITEAASERDHEKRSNAAKRPSPLLQAQLDAANRLELMLRDELEQRFHGWPPHEIATHAPHQGDVAAIRERRRRMHRRAIDGRVPLTAEERAECEAWLFQTGASVREIERTLDVSYRAALQLQRSWDEAEEAA